MVIHGVLFLFYWLFLKNSLRHQLNRLFLLSGLCLAFLIPFIELPEPESIPIVSQNELVITWLSEPVLDYEVVMAPIMNQESENASYWFILPLIYVGITLFFVIRSILSLAIIQRLKAHSVAIKKYWFKLFKTSHSRPFSFFSNVFIPESLFDSDDFDQVLAHECVHVKQRHSLDRLLLDFVVSLFWFNPFIYLYRNALIEIHEYQADEAVVNRFKDPIRYQEILFSQLQTPQYSGMVSHFNVEIIKKRIVMMNKQNKKSSWIYAVTVPLTLAMIFAFSNKSAMKPIEMIGDEMAGVIEPADFQFPKLNFYQTDYRPSILPLKNAENVRWTSGFGTRMHPIYKVEKMHNGIDFSCPMGSEIIATADGTVEEIKATLDGYGKMISIKHGDKFTTRYAQLSEFKVKKGDRVKEGQVIALSGNSGASTAPHLHYEVIEAGVGHVDPQPFIKNYAFKTQVKEVVPRNSQGKKQEEIAEKELHLAKEQAERAQIEVIRAEEQRNLASEAQKEVHQLQREAEEKRVVAEKIREEETKEPVIEITTKDKQKKKNKSEQKDKSKSNHKKEAYRVIIDPGHGGKDSGEKYAENLYEKDLVLAIAERVKEEFKEQSEIEIILTRDTDHFLSLPGRRSKAEGADLFISLHAQDYKDAFGGSVVLMYGNGNHYRDRSEQIATMLHDNFNELNDGECSIASFSSGGVIENEYWLLENIEVPAVMVQFGLEEGKELEFDESTIASKIATGIRIAAF